MKKMGILPIILMIVGVGFLSGCNKQENDFPIASISSDINSGYSPLTVSFTGSGFDSDGEIVSYHWNFGDGFTSFQQNTTHTYNEEGKFTVSLTVTDNTGATDVDTVIINVLVQEPEIVKHTSYSYLGDRVSVDGIVKNVANVPINDIELKVTLYDKSGNVIETNREWSDITNSYNYDYTYPRYILPGETAFFSVSFENINYYDHYDFEILSFDTGYSYGCREGLVIRNAKDDIGILGYEVTGSIKNEGTNKHSLVTVCGAFYDSSGKLLCVNCDYSLPLDLYSGQEEEFKITVYDWNIDPNKISSYELKISTFCYS